MLAELFLAVWPTALLASTLLWAALTWAPVFRMWTLARKLPGPFAWPFVGNSIAFMKGPEETFNAASGVFAHHGDVVRLWLGTKLVVGIASPADAQLIMSHPRVINRDYHVTKTISGFLKSCLLTVRDDDVRVRRKIIGPAFHLKVLVTYIEIFGQKAEQLAARLAVLADGRVVDIKDKLSFATLDSIIETAIGVNLTSEVDSVRKMKENVDKGLSLAHSRMERPWLLMDPLYSLTSGAKQAAIVNKISHDFFKDVMATRLEEIQSRSEKGLVKPKGKAQSFLDTVYDATSSGEALLTEEVIRGEVLTLVSGGMDTSANTMAYALIMLGINPKYQEKVLEEQRAVFQDSLRPSTLEDLSKLTFLEMVIKETLRLYPPSTFYPREIPVDIELSNGHVLPAGCSVYISSQNIHRDARNFVKPEAFWPERWLPENSVGRDPHAFIPFGGGARVCIGQKYAFFQLKATLSRLLRQFSFKSGYKMKELDRIELSITNKSAVGYDVQIYPRVK